MDGKEKRLLKDAIKSLNTGASDVKPKRVTQAKVCTSDLLFYTGHITIHFASQQLAADCETRYKVSERAWHHQNKEEGSAAL